MKKISFVIPCHNEEANLPKLYDELDRFTRASYQVSVKETGTETGTTHPVDMNVYDFEFLFVNDGSGDGTLAIMRELRKKDSRVSVVNLSRNFGKENAMLAGMDYASGDALVIMDADLQDPIEVVPEMIYWWEKGYDDVYGKRASRGQESAMRKILSLSFYNMLKKMSDIDILPNVGDFRLLDRRAVRALTGLRETQRYMKGLYCWVGFEKKRWYLIVETAKTASQATNSPNW